MDMNWLALLVAAFVPTIIGFIWYNPKVLGTAWMKAADMTEEKMKGANMPLVFGLSLVLSFMLALSIGFIVIHQTHINSILIDEVGFGDPTSEVGILLANFMAKYGNNFRTFGHGAFHGIITGILLVNPILATNAMFERKGFKYIAINCGYWIITLALMGGIICGWV